MITIKHKGNFKYTEDFLKRSIGKDYTDILRIYGQRGVDALSSNTPKDSGETADSWGYEIEKKGDTYSIIWTNSNVNDGVNIAIILRYGHGTGTGGYVEGRDYITPALQPIFDEMANSVWKEMTR